MSEPNSWLPIIFFFLMGFSALMYAILDGYDLGVGILLPQNEENRNIMIASIGPFWDANETWLVLAVGLLLIAFPAAHNIVLEALYLPTAIMLIAIIFRGVAFDFRAKVKAKYKLHWDIVFKISSLSIGLTQGYMLGQYVIGFKTGSLELLFSFISAFGIASAYSYIGASWLVMKTEGNLQKLSAKWAKRSGRFAAVGVLLVCAVNPMVHPEIMDRWFSLPGGILLLIIPLSCAALFVLVDRFLTQMPFENDFGCWIPFVSSIVIFCLCFQGLAFSFYPFIIPNTITIWEASSASASLEFLLYGVVVVVPTILIYTLFSYRVFWGKASKLSYYQDEHKHLSENAKK